MKLNFITKVFLELLKCQDFLDYLKSIHFTQNFFHGLFIKNILTYLYLFHLLFLLVRSFLIMIFSFVFLFSYFSPFLFDKIVHDFDFFEDL
jgi:hypothetical protein